MYCKKPAKQQQIQTNTNKNHWIYRVSSQSYGSLKKSTRYESQPRINDTPELMNLGISESSIKLFQDFPKVPESDGFDGGESGGSWLVGRSVGRSMDRAVGCSDPPTFLKSFGNLDSVKKKAPEQNFIIVQQRFN